MRITIDDLPVFSRFWNPESGFPEIRFLGESINPNRIFAYAYTSGKSWRRLHHSFSTAVRYSSTVTMVYNFKNGHTCIVQIESV